MRLSCQVVEGLLSEYIDGELSRRDHMAVSAHLAGCKRCRREAEELRRTIDLVRKDEVPMPSESYFDGLWPEIAAELEGVNLRTGVKLYLRQKLRTVEHALERWGISWKIKYVAITLMLVVLSLLVDRTLFRPSVDELLFNTIQRTLSSAGSPLLAVKGPRYSSRPITAEYKTGFIAWRREEDGKGKEQLRLMGLMINLKSIQIKDGVLTVVGDIDLTGLPRDEVSELLKFEGLPAPEVKTDDIALAAPSRVWLPNSPEPPSRESRLRSIYADTDTAFANISIDDLNLN
jgi:hypothetical protein